MRFRLPELHLGDMERGARDIQNAIWCSYGHFGYREKIIKCVWRGETTTGLSDLNRVIRHFQEP